MSVQLPLQEYALERAAKMKQWESDFNRNYETLARDISKGVFDQIKAAFNPEEPRKFQYEINFDITELQSIESLQNWAPSITQLAPFDEWIQFFSENQSATNEKYYFWNLMQLVVEVCHQTLKKDLAALTSPHEGWSFKVHYGDSKHNTLSDLARSLTVKLSYKTPERGVTLYAQHCKRFFVARPLMTVCLCALLGAITIPTKPIY